MKPDGETSKILSKRIEDLELLYSHPLQSNILIQDKILKTRIEIIGLLIRRTKECGRLGNYYKN